MKTPRPEPIRCPICRRGFWTTGAMHQHKRDSHGYTNRLPKMNKDAAMATLEAIGDDLPDGAYLAMAEELGLSVDDLTETPERSAT